MTDNLATLDAAALDAADPLASFRNEFLFPSHADGTPEVYLVGNSLGLQPRSTRGFVEAELDAWAARGVRGHFEGEHPWEPYHEFLTEPMARIVGGLPSEVVVMNSLTVNLHLMMVSFYRPTLDRHAILVEEHAFPSDHFAAESQIRHHGFDPARSLITVSPRDGENTIRPDDLLATIERHGDELALVMLPGVQYYTGQVFDMAAITAAGHAVGAKVGFDLAHAAGNIELALHDWDADFAVWCTYKYLNAGPGAVGGAFVHERHHTDPDIQRFTGWWGTDKATRFEMATVFDAIPTVEAWQVSNAPILSMAALRSSLDVVERAGGMAALRAKSEKLVAFMDHLLDSRLPGRVESITPRAMDQRGCQFALRITSTGHEGRAIYEALEAAGVACDWRHPDVIRVAAVPLYNSFADVERFIDILDGLLS